MLLVCIKSCLKSVLQVQILVLDTYHPDTLHLRGQRYEDPWPFFEIKMDKRAKILGNTGLIYLTLYAERISLKSEM
jgi:hypothetical protein